MRIKYPRTPHLPWSPGATNDDIRQANTELFEGKKVVVTEKMDGENTTLYSDYLHARSVDSRFHPSRNWVKALHAQMGYKIPTGWRICGENLYARHSIAYENLASYFMAFSVWDEHNACLSWEDSKPIFSELGLVSPPEIYTGIWNEQLIKGICLDSAVQEGYVVRLADSFHFEDFGQSVAKWVRPNHVTTDKHWMHKAVIANGLKSRKQGG